MKLSVDILAERMRSYDISVYSTERVTPRLEGLRFFDKELRITEKNYLYIGYADDLPKLADLPIGVSILCIGVPHDLDPEQNLPIDIIVLNEQYSLGKLFNEIQELFLFFNKWEHHMQELILNNCTLQQLVDISDKVIGWPISIVDRAEKTLAVSQFEETDDVIWSEIRRGYIRTELLQQDSVKTSEIALHHHPMQMYSTISNRVLLSQAIRVNGHVVGFVAVHRPEPGPHYFTWGVVQLLDFFTQHVATHMRSNEFFNFSRGMMFECLLVDLIQNKMSDEAVIADRLAFLEWNLEGSKQIIRVETNENDIKVKTKKLKIMRDQLEGIIPSCKSIIYDKGLAAIISNVDVSTLPDQIKSKFIVWLQENNAYCGISNKFTLLSKTINYYNQALKSIRFGKTLNPKQHLYYYHDYTIMHVAELLSVSIDLKSLFHPAIEKLLALCEKSPFFYETLKVYLCTERNIAVSSKLLYIHRNTMIYRIKRLEEELACDFSDYNTCKSLSFSLELLEYLNNFNNNTNEDQNLRKNNNRRNAI